MMNSLLMCSSCLQSMFSFVNKMLFISIWYYQSLLLFLILLGYGKYIFLSCIQEYNYLRIVLRCCAYGGVLRFLLATLSNYVFNTPLVVGSHGPLIGAQRSVW